MSSSNPPTNLQTPAPTQAQVSVPPHLSTPPKPGAAALTKSKPEAHPPRNSFRELVETVVFVTVLVLLLKSFVAEAFVIPTGSMAEALLGYRAFVTCPECCHEFPINMSEEIEPQEGNVTRVRGCTCPNCHLKIVRNDNDNWVRNPP